MKCSRLPPASATSPMPGCGGRMLRRGRRMRGRGVAPVGSLWTARCENSAHDPRGGPGWVALDPTAGWPRLIRFGRGGPGWVALDPTGAAQPEEVPPREIPPREPPVPRHTGRLQSEPTCATRPRPRDFFDAEATGPPDPDARHSVERQHHRQTEASRVEQRPPRGSAPANHQAIRCGGPGHSRGGARQRRLFLCVVGR